MDQRLAAVRGEMLREAGEARQEILRVTLESGVSLAAGRSFGTHGAGGYGSGSGSGSNGDRAGGEPGSGGHSGTAQDGDAFISIAEARRRRAAGRREAAVREAAEVLRLARGRIERVAREWDGAMMARDHAVEEINAWAQQLVAAYRSGVMRAHPRREEIPALWKGEVVVMDTASSLAGAEEIGRLLVDVEQRVEVWRVAVGAPPELGSAGVRALGAGADPAGPDGSQEDRDPPQRRPEAEPADANGPERTEAELTEPGLTEAGLTGEPEPPPPEEEPAWEPRAWEPTSWEPQAWTPMDSTEAQEPEEPDRHTPGQNGAAR